MFLSRFAWRACVALILYLFLPLSHAQDALEEIVVRGELRQSTLSATAGSVSVVSLNEPQAGVLDHLEEVLNRVPNVNFASGASRARFIQIRGIGERGQFSEPLNSSVGLILDGVDMSGVGTAATLFDVDQVEVFRGPQGTLYGANALAGLINVRSNAPTDVPAAKLTADVGEFGANGLGGVVSGPLADSVNGRFAWRRYRDDGFIRNAFLGRDDTTRHDEETWRAQLSWSASDSSELAVMLGRVVVDNGYDNFSLDNTRVTLSDDPGQDEQTTNYGSLRWSRDMASGREINVNVGHADSEIDYGYDEDWTFEGFDPFGYSSTDRYRRDRSTTTLDLRMLSASSEAAGSTDWVVGLFGLEQTVSLDREYTFLPAPFDSQYNISRLAVYGELTHHLSENTRITAGLRAENHQSDYDDSDGLSFKPSDDLLGGRLQIEHDLSSGALLSAGITRGYKAGGFNTDGSLDADLREFDPEVLWNFELGLSQRWWDDRLQFRGSLFYMRRDDIQISTSIVRERPDGSSEFIDFVGNGAEGDNVGAEFEARWRASDRVSVFSTLGLLDTQFSNYTNGAGDNLDDRAQAQSPGYQFHVGVDYQTASGWYARFEVEGRDEFFFSDSHASKSQSYELLHAALGFAAERWSAKLWGRNLTDEDVAVRGFFFGNDPRDNYTPRVFTQLGEPARLGLSMTFAW